MIVSGGKILAIDGVEHDFTLSGDGVKTPIGITEELLEKIRDVSGKLDTTDFESWSAQTEHWDVQEYSGGEGIKVENHLISVSAKYLTSGDLEPYATKAWVEDQKYLTSGDLEPYAKTQWVMRQRRGSKIRNILPLETWSLTLRLSGFRKSSLRSRTLLLCLLMQTQHGLMRISSRRVTTSHQMSFKPP